ncbi:isochorismatase family protein [Amycolatopsis cihanbeyliensis]|uniref:Bifunctional isochorismate lyase/aryl carrier protein n=1 Tax=Amycolatopsis cihanbeyliensis TaxID=1128664 RepID=A0A542DBH6_AMYCI|nr:isochorismatase family protein [Amycolatopsis cihanbeyliensis]TQJ00416.1 bifunctional isochorismate lyase/aryl carrier protein [Amycolatopsis cihanbeyliensis]
MLPTIAPYPLPVRSELPDNRVAWRADPSRAVLLVHDMQNYFLAAFGDAGSPLPAAVDNIAALRKHCAELAVPVIFTGQPPGQSAAQRGLLQEFWGSGLPDDPHAAAITTALEPGPGDLRLTKARYSAFVGTDLAELLGERDQLILTGVYAHIGVLATAVDAFMRDVRPFVVADAVADFGPEEHERAMRQVAQRCGSVTTTAALVDDLDAGAR